MALHPRKATSRHHSMFFFSSRPNGAKGCSHGWSAAEPVEGSLESARPGRGGGTISRARALRKPPRSATSPSILILKLGGSILTGDSDLSLAAHEIYRHLRRGTKVIAVVSALHGHTDRLLSRARRFTDRPSDAAIASLLSTGELTSAAILTLACERAGIPARTLDTTQIRLRAEGPTLDATPISVDTAVIYDALDEHPVLIIPGFLGRDSAANPVLFGRGGSDLTALFLSRELNAPARLLKDVAGVFDKDPKEVDGATGGRGSSADARATTSARRYSTLAWSDLDALKSRVVQPRTATFAREHKIPFEVGAPLSDDVTRIGPKPTALANSAFSPQSSALKVALLGHGTVGAGVAEAIRRLPAHFTLTSIAVRDPGKHLDRRIPKRLLTTDPYDAVDSDADVVIELIGGLGPARDLIARSLVSGKHVITANKAVVAEHGNELRSLAAANNVQLLYSAAVGGSLPILETARRLEETRGLTSLSAILNGATNFILTRIDEGLSFPEAVAEAQARGLTEADPTRDLSGQGALDKLQVIAQELWPDLPVDAQLTPLPHFPIPGVRQVAHLTRLDSSIQLRVGPESGPLSRCAHENNLAVFTTRDGHQTQLSGKGAGRHPTTESVLADLLSLTSASY